MADGTGYEHGAFVFGAALALLAAAYYSTNISRVFLFWAAFILTRPLGATVGDFLDKPSATADWRSAGRSPPQSSALHHQCASSCCRSGRASIQASRGAA